MSQKQIFRKVALERLSSPEQLDQLMQVTTPKGWLALFGLGIVLLVMITWGALGRVPVTVSGAGILLKTEGVRNVTAPHSGLVSRLFVVESSLIATDEIVAQINQDGVTYNIRSPFSGQVSELRTSTGEVVNIGDALFSLVLAEAMDDDLETVLYLPAADAKKIEPGMTARVSPSTVRREAFGFILGTVTRVNEFPSTRDGMQRTLGNEEWVANFSNVVAPVEIRVALTPNPDTMSGYEWSSRGPNVTIGNGTPCEVDIVLEEITPLQLLIAF